MNCSDIIEQNSRPVCQGRCKRNPVPVQAFTVAVQIDGNFEPVDKGGTDVAYISIPLCIQYTVNQFWMLNCGRTDDDVIKSI